MCFSVIILLMQVSAEESVKAECESCGAKIPIDATECPECGAVFAEEEKKEYEEIEEIEDEEIEEPKVEKKGGKALLVSGIILILIGGPGLALGSWLHDVLEISFLGYTSYDSFGWLNMLVAVIGLVIFVIGIIFVALSRKK